MLHCFYHTMLLTLLLSKMIHSIHAWTKCAHATSLDSLLNDHSTRPHAAHHAAFMCGPLHCAGWRTAGICPRSGNINYRMGLHSTCYGGQVLFFINSKLVFVNLIFPLYSEFLAKEGGLHFWRFLQQFHSGQTEAEEYEQILNISASLISPLRSELLKVCLHYHHKPRC